MPRIIVLEVDVWKDGALSTERFATHTINTKPTDTPANATYSGRIKDAGSVKRSVSLLGRLTTSSGAIDLNNADGALDYLWDCGFGRPYRMKELQSKDDAVGSAPVVAAGIALSPSSSDPFKIISIPLRDNLEALKTPLLTARYAGNTTDGTMLTIEGNEDLKDKLKPLVVTSRANITPYLVNPFHLVYQVSHPYPGAKAVTSIVVRDGGLALDFYQDFPTAAALFAATFPTEATTQRYATCRALGLFRLNDAPVNAITADVEVGTAADRSAARAAQTMLAILNADGAGVTVNSASFDAMHAAKPAEVVLYVDAETNADDLIVSALGWVGQALDPGPDGVFRAFSIGIPAGTPEKVFTPRDWSNGSFSIRANPEAEGGAEPNYQAVVKFGGVQTVQTADQLVGQVTENNPSYVQFVSQAYQEAATPDGDATADDILEAFPSSVPLTVETGIRYQADALARAYEFRALFGVRRDRNSIDVDASIGRKALGSVQSLKMPRLGYRDGKLGIILGRTDDLNKGRVTLEPFV